MFAVSRQREFFLSVALPTALLALATAAVVFLALERMAGVFNGFDQRYEADTISALLTQQIARIDHEYAALAARTADGAEADAGLPAPLLLVIDAAARPQRAVAGGRSVDPATIGADPADIAALASRLGAGGPATAAGLVGARAGILFASLGPLPAAAGRPAGYALLARPLADAGLAATAADFGIHDLAWRSETAETDEAVALVSASGRTSGYLSWTPRGSGSRAMSQVAGPMMLVLALLYVGLAFLVLTNWTLNKAMRAGEAEAQHDARHDALSGLPNRASFHHQLDRMARQTPPPVLTVMFVDLDGFKEVNDTYGHEVGDRLIKAVAAGFACLVDGRATLARLGGDEFAVVLKGYQSFAESVELASRMIAFLEEPFTFEGRSVRVGASIGLASSDEEPLTSVELVRRADVAMYAAKARGKNRIEVYSPDLDAGRAEKVELAAALRRALDGDELQIRYQPVVDAASGRIATIEALIRWIHPHHGPIRPAVFLPIAEEAGFTEILGTWVLRRVCREARDFGDVRIAVNIFAAQFKNPLFDEQLKTILGEEGFPASRLELDINESYLIAFPDRAQRMIIALHRLGVHVALDDFGTGFSSISYLRRFAFDKVKIDRSVVIDVVRDPASQQLVRSTVALADALGVDVTAEGIEREDEAEALTAAGCRELQGFYFGAPIMPGEIIRRLRHEQAAPDEDRRTA